MIRPLIEHADGLLGHQVREGVFCDDCCAKTGDQLVDAMVDLWINMIRTADEHDDAPPLFTGFFNHLCALVADIRHIGVIRIIGCAAGFFYFTG